MILTPVSFPQSYDCSYVPERVKANMGFQPRAFLSICCFTHIIWRKLCLLAWAQWHPRYFFKTCLHVYLSCDEKWHCSPVAHRIVGSMIRSSRVWIPMMPLSSMPGRPRVQNWSCSPGGRGGLQYSRGVQTEPECGCMLLRWPLN